MKQTISFVVHPITMFFVLCGISILSLHLELLNQCNVSYSDVMLVILTAYFFLGISTITHYLNVRSKDLVIKSLMELVELRTETMDIQKDMIESLLEKNK